MSLFIQSAQVDQICPSTIILASSQSQLLEYLRADMEGLNPK